MLAVEGEQRAEVDVGDAVGVGGAEGLAAKPVAEPRDPPAGRRVEPGVDALDLDPSGQSSAATNSSTISPR